MFYINKTRHAFAVLFALFAVFSSLSYAADESTVTAESLTDKIVTYKGTVISYFNEDGYTYIKYLQGNAVSWVAVLQTPVKENDIVEFPDSQPLLNYQTRYIKEPFEKIFFASEIKISEPEKPITPSPEESKSDQTVIPTQREIQADKAIPAATEEVKAEKPPVPKDDAKEKRNTHRGKVISSINTSGYSYIEYDEDGVTSWVAVSQQQVNAGDIIEFPKSEIFTNFFSKSLGKTFDRLYMASEFRIVPKETDDQQNTP